MSDLFGNHIVGFPTRRLILFMEINAKHMSGDIRKVNNVVSEQV